MNIVITMAGLGERFRKAGFTVPKYQIPVLGKTLFEWAVGSLQHFVNGHTRFIFIARAADRADGFIQLQCLQLGISNFKIVELDALTDGQATTVLHAESVLSGKAAPLLIYNIDTHVDPDALRPERMRGAGWIPCFPGDGEGWSFVKADAFHQALEVREKQRISPHATIGLYGFESYERYQDIYATYYADPAHIECRERYIAPLYNQLIQERQPVFIELLSKGAVFPLGTPDEVRAFKLNHPKRASIV